MARNAASRTRQACHRGTDL